MHRVSLVLSVVMLLGLGALGAQSVALAQGGDAGG